MTLSRALDGLNDALENLERTVEAMADEAEREPAGRIEVQRLNIDRAELASKLDGSEARAMLLTEANKEVSRRLIAAMETIRTVLDRP